MIRHLAILAAAATLPLAVPAMAQDVVNSETRYAPAPLWYRGPDRAHTAAGGRVRIVEGGGISAALGVNEYVAYQLLYREALASLSMRMPVVRADPEARRLAVAGVIARYPSTRAAAFRLSPVDNARVSGR